MPTPAAADTFRHETPAGTIEFHGSRTVAVELAISKEWLTRLATFDATQARYDREHYRHIRTFTDAGVNGGTRLRPKPTLDDLPKPKRDKPAAPVPFSESTRRIEAASIREQLAGNRNRPATAAGSSPAG